jgi:ABC-type Fe3+/spermidine/putrescine transport system ATPase subunit
MSDARIEIIDLTVHYGEVAAVNGISLTIAQGEHVTLLGPSGCGKTTTLRAIAGLEEPSGGTIRIYGAAVYSAAQKRNVPAEKRGVSMVFQSYAVWPHMSVFDNVAYGLRVRKLPGSDVEQAVARALDLVQMRGFAARSAALLSGGQQQRVALARALAFSPNVLLFELRELQRRLGVTSVYVTHDQEEALAISDRVVVMNVGGIEQIGSPEDIYNRPKTRFVADFVGSANLIAGKLRGGTAAAGLVGFDAEGGVQLQAWAAQPPRGGEDTVAVRTAYIDLAAGAPNGRANSVAGTIRQRLFHGDFIQYIVDCPVGQLTVRRPPTELLDEGAAVTISFAPEHCILLEG